MKELLAFLIVVGGIGLFIFIMRFVGAWMLRINELITGQEKTNDLLKKLNEKL